MMVLDLAYRLMVRVARLLPSRWFAREIGVASPSEVAAAEALIRLLESASSGRLIFYSANREIRVEHETSSEASNESPDLDESWRHICGMGGLPADCRSGDRGCCLMRVPDRWYRCLFVAEVSDGVREMQVEVVASGVGEIPFSEMRKAHGMRKTGR